MEALRWDIRVQAAGRTYTVNAPESGADAPFSLEVRWDTDAQGRVLSAVLTPREALTLEHARATLPFSLIKTDRIFLNGYQSWTDSRETAVGKGMRGLGGVPHALVRAYAFDRYGDYDFTRYPAPHGFSYCYRRRGESCLLAASLAENSGFTVFYPDARRGLLTLEKECSGLQLPAGRSYEVVRVAFLEGGEDAVFDAWFRLLQIAPPTAAPVWGYTSWYHHYQNISETLLQKTLAQAPQDWQIFQIDDGWEPAIGDWLIPDAAKFPSGMRPLAQAITQKGMLPGLWLAPFAAQKDSVLAKTHPDWLVRGADGAPVLCGSNWGGFYALDFYQPAVRAYLRQVFARVVGEWGYRLLKLDFLYAVCVLPRPDKTRGQIMCEAMDFLRECAGEAKILGCGVPLAAAFGKVEYCRIGADVSLIYDDVPYMRLLHRERISTKNNLQNSVWRRQLNGRAFWNDPDVFVLRESGHKLTPGQRRALATINALCGGLLLTSDLPGRGAREARGQGAQANAQEALLQEIRSLRGATLLGAAQKRGMLTLRYMQGGQHKRCTVRIGSGKCFITTDA